MSSIELKEKIHAIIDRHAGNDEWLARVFEILESGESVQDGNWWEELTDEQKARIDESIAAANRGEFISNDDVLDNL
jgi:hypothetical protein